MRNALILTIFALSTRVHISTKADEDSVNVYNQISSPLYISNKSGHFSGNLKEQKSILNFTISGWYRHNKLPLNSSINIISIRNGLVSKGQDNSKFPECPLSEEVLIRNPQFLKDFLIKNNPNCFTDRNRKFKKLKAQSQNEEISLVFKILMKNQKGLDKFIIQLPKLFNPSTNVLELLEEELTGINFSTNSWLFFSCSLDFPNGKGNIFFKFFSEKTQILDRKFEINLPEMKLKEGFLIYHSENPSRRNDYVYGYLFDLNIYNFVIQDLNTISLFNVFNGKPDNQLAFLDLIFHKLKDQPYIRDSNTQSSLAITGEYQNYDNGIEFKPNSDFRISEFNDFGKDNILSTPTFMFQIEIQDSNFEQFSLMTGVSANGSNKIEVKIVGINSEGKSGFGLNVSIYNEQININYISPVFITPGVVPLFILSVVCSPNNTTNIFIYHSDSQYIVSRDFKDFKFDFGEMTFILSDKKNKNQNIIYHRFALLESAIGAIFAVNSKLNKINSPCLIPLLPYSTSKSCLACQNSTYLPFDHKCSSFCTENFKNAMNTCVPCSTPECAEVERVKISIDRLENNKFMLKLNQSLPAISPTNINTFFNITLENLTPEIDYTHSIQFVNPKSFLLQIYFTNAVYDTQLKISLRGDKQNLLYDKNRNYVPGLNAEYHIPVIRNIESSVKSSANALAGIVIALYYICVFVGIILLILSFRFNLSDYSCKKIALNLQIIQLIPFWILFNIPLPANLFEFLTVIYGDTVGLSSKFFKLNSHSFIKSNNEFFPNIYDKEFTWLFVDNFGFYIFAHFLIISFYFGLMITNCFYRCFSIKLKEKILRLREIFEYNFLIISFVVFDHKTFTFAFLNIIDVKFDSSLSIFSFTLALLYIGIYIFGFCTFAWLYFVKSYFVQHSEFKYKISYLLVGYKNRQFANFYETLRIFVHCALGIVLITAKVNPIVQLVLYLTILFAFFAVTLIYSPHERKINLRFEIFTQICLIASVLLLITVGFMDWNKNFNVQDRENIGFVIMILLIFMIMFNLIYDLLSVSVFLWKTRCSSKLIFLDEEKNSNPAHKIESEDDLDNEIFFCRRSEANVLCEKRRTWGNLGSLARTSTHDFNDGNQIFRLGKIKVGSKSSLNPEELKSGKASGHDGYISQTESSDSSDEGNPKEGMALKF
jgi:hypothetical protein